MAIQFKAHIYVLAILKPARLFSHALNQMGQKISNIADTRLHHVEIGEDGQLMFLAKLLVRTIFGMMARAYPAMTC